MTVTGSAQPANQASSQIGRDWLSLKACSIAYLLAADTSYKQAEAARSESKSPEPEDLSTISVKDAAEAITSVNTVTDPGWEDSQRANEYTVVGRRFYDEAAKAYASDKKLAPAIAAEAFEKDTTPPPKYALYQCSSLRAPVRSK